MSGEEGPSTLQPDRPAIDLLLVFQKTVQTIIFTEYMNITETQDKEKGTLISLQILMQAFACTKLFIFKLLWKWCCHCFVVVVEVLIEP